MVTATSSLGIVPPKRRANPDHSGEAWLEDKRETDGAEGLWRIHDDLYDLTSFIKSHPGGSDWLELTRGTDITEAFEVHHLTEGPEEMKKKYFVRKAASKRNAPFTFAPDGFYMTLKKEVREQIKQLPKQSSKDTDFMIDAMLVLMIIFAITANTYGNYALATLAGSLLAMVAIAAHNYFHRRNNLRMFYFNLSLMSLKEWRISHVLSHHLHTNTIDDLEISTWEPLLMYLPIKKSKLQIYKQYLAAPFLWIFGAHMQFIKRIICTVKGLSKFAPSDYIGLLLPTIMYLATEQSLFHTFWFWMYITIIASLHFLFVGLHAGHHHPDIFHDGDTPRSVSNYDWGLSQLDAVMDRKEISGSHFLVLTNFGDHALHHLFPTLDHGLLEHLYPTFQKVLAKFDADIRIVSQLDLIVGGFQQLGRVKPNPEKPDLKKYSK